LRILFIKLRHIGDSLLLTPTIAATKQKFPHAEIWVLVRQSCGGILAGCPEIDRILETANPDSSKRTRWGWLSDLRLAALLRRTHFDHVFELTDNDRARFLAIAARTPSRCTNRGPSLRWFWRPFFGHIEQTKRYMEHRVVRDFVCPRGVLGLTGKPGPLRFDESRMVPWEASRYGSGEPFAAMHIHTRWPEKSWPAARWEELAARLLEFVPRIVLSCGPEDAQGAARFAARVGPRLQTTGGSTNWAQLAWLLKRAKFFVGVDTAAMHLAAACGCPTVALFGPSPALEFRPWEVCHWLLQPGGTSGPMERIGVADALECCKEAYGMPGAGAAPP